MRIMSTITENLIHYALTRGIIYGIKPNALNPPTKIDNVASTVVHAPFTLEPYKYPKKAFEESVQISPIFNLLVDKISRDSVWLQEVLLSTAQSDDFTNQLLTILKTVESEGVKQSLSLGIIRSDYMLHQVIDDSRGILQVEINTIASSFGSLSTKIAEMHQLFYPSLLIPQNHALQRISQAIAFAHINFINQQKSFITQSIRDYIVVMIVQAGERNFSDQRHVHFTLLEAYGINMVRLSLAQVERDCELDAETGLLTYNGSPISVIYYRAGYSPDDYPSSLEWSARLKIERSSAIKCPNIGLHLAGCKKIQQVLATPGQLERFISNNDECSLLRKVFAGLYSLDESEYFPTQVDEIDSNKSKRVKIDPSTQIKVSTLDEVISMAVKDSSRYVMKPQREGGGNNIYGSNVVSALQTMSREELRAFILMERIFPPSQRASLVREGHVYEDSTLCELGIYGAYLSDSSGFISTETLEEEFINLRKLLKSQHSSTSIDGFDGNSVDRVSSAHTEMITVPGNQLTFNHYCGYLLRVKPSSSDEGGVAAGYSVLSAPSME